MSTTSLAIAVLRKGLARVRRSPHPGRDTRGETSIVPKDSIAANALAAVVAIMTFLAAVTSGGVAMVIGSANEWQSEVAREMTIQVRPIPGRDIEAEVGRAQALARAAPGVVEARTYTREESDRLLEPWLGSGLSLDDLPVPRMIAVKIARGAAVDTAALRRSLARDVVGASLDDHRGGIDRMRRMAKAAIAGGIGIFGLVLAATILSVAFATRGAMASNWTIVEVLHFVGAKEAYIASQFQRHFLGLGLKGGVLGGAAAILGFVLVRSVSDLFVGTAGEAEAAALFGGFSLGFMGYVVVAAEVVLIAAITALTSRQVVIHTLRRID
ncbi:MAG TPA: ABC transporter permease [Xanthobacteraceae bacterium]|nr:ABC transporter permease [Xanthobacteraceae bacterium]